MWEDVETKSLSVAPRHRANEGGCLFTASQTTQVKYVSTVVQSKSFNRNRLKEGSTDTDTNSNTG